MYNPKSIVENCDLVFLCKSHGDAEDIVPELVRVANKFEKTIKFIDLSADFRLKKPMLYKKWYGYNHHHLNLLKDAVYGLPELYADEIKSAF